MRVKMLATAAGPNGVFPAGQVVDVDEILAKAFIAGGYAESVDKATDKPGPESAAIEPPEKAVLPAPKRKKVK